MKKSLNNKIRGKRLVMGDENEVTSHEMLVEDKDGKIIVKQRGADGKMESVSEGGTYNEEYAIIQYYTQASKGSKNLTGYISVPYINLLEFATGECDKRIIEGIKGVDESSLTSKVMYSRRLAKVITSFRDDFIIKLNTDENKINIDIPSTSASEIIVTTNENGPLYDIFDIPRSELSIRVVNSSGSVTEPSYGLYSNIMVLPYQETIGFYYIYDAASNFLSCVETINEPTIYVNIDPSKADTLKVHYNHDGDFSDTKALFINGKEVDPKTRDITIGSDTIFLT